jgi:molecular chaperone IbpA
MEDLVMRTQDFSIFTRNAIGFDRIFDLLNNSSQILDGQGDYPPYDIARTGEETYRISLALAGWSSDQLTITSQQNVLRISGQKPEDGEAEYLHQGIPSRSFELQFSLEDHVEVEGASFDNGLLQIELVRRVPEVMKARRIPIGKGASRPKPDSQLKIA